MGSSGSSMKLSLSIVPSLQTHRPLTYLTIIGVLHLEGVTKAVENAITRAKRIGEQSVSSEYLKETALYVFRLFSRSTIFPRYELETAFKILDTCSLIQMPIFLNENQL